MWLLFASVASLAQTPPEPAAPQPVAPQPISSQRVPRRQLKGWEKPSLYMGLGLTATSLIGGYVWFDLESRTCSDEGYSTTTGGSSVCDPVLPVFLGLGGAVTGLALTGIGGVGLLAAPKGATTVVVTGRF